LYLSLDKKDEIMDSLEVTKPAPASSTPSAGGAPAPTVASCCSTATFPPDVVRSWLGNRRVLAVGGLALGGAGLALGWDWLAAVGIAPLIVSAAPCLVMCALGLCMMGRGHRPAAAQPTADSSEARTPIDPPVSR